MAGWYQNWISFYGDKSNSSTDPTNGKADERIGLCYDGDNVGFEATNRGIELLRQNSRLALSVVVVPEKLDPDEYLRKYGEASFQELVAHGRETVFTFKSRYLKQGKNLDNEKTRSNTSKNY